MLESNSFGLSNLDSPGDFGSLFEADILLDNDVNRFDRFSSSSCSTSPLHSLSNESSEAGDWTPLEYFTTLNENKFVDEKIEDPLLTGVTTINENIPTDTFCLSSLEWPTLDSSVMRLPCRKNSNKISKPAEKWSPSIVSKPWSRMTVEEQEETLETITRVISQKMGLREKLEIFRILNPEAEINLSNTTEFTIEFKYLNDTKLQDIKNYIHMLNESNSNWRRNNNTVNKYKNASSMKTSCSTCSSTSFVGKIKSTQSKERRDQVKALRNYQRKAQRQLLKEQRSGLFLREEVLSLSRHSQNDDNDVDILE